MNELGHHILQSLPEYTALIGLFIVAVVANMPRPEKFNNNVWYTWLYESLQAFLAAKNPHPTTPADPAQPQK